MSKSLLLFKISIFLLTGCDFYQNQESKIEQGKKINGVNFVAPKNVIDGGVFKSLKRINAQWISIIPYAYTPKKSAHVIFYNKHPHWWGEGIEGSIETILLAKKEGLKIMLKPHVWVIGSGWPGEFQPQTEEDWMTWENDYAKYILTYAKIGDSLNVESFCIGTEYKLTLESRKSFWIDLISKIREVYSGKLTYAANWDSFHLVPFWQHLDFIGINAYFPLDQNKTPEVKKLMAAWEKELKVLKELSLKTKRPILFTEYGYKSIDYNAKGHWESNSEYQVNLTAQYNAYQAFYTTAWSKEYVVGGFLWKWFSNDVAAGGQLDQNFTPQNKPAESLIQLYYSKNSHHLVK